MYQKIDPFGYAIALYELVKEENNFEKVHGQINEFKNVWTSNQDFKYFINNRSISDEEKFKLINEIFQEFEPLVKNFIKVVIQKKATTVFKRILVQYLKLSNEELDIEFAKVKTAFPLSDEEYDRIKQKLQNHYKKRIELQVDIDPKLISGYEIRIGAEIIQKNVISDLEKLKNYIIYKKEV